MRINFASTRLAFFLIAFLSLLLLLSAIIPQSDLADSQLIFWDDVGEEQSRFIESLALDQIYDSPYLFAVIFLLGVNLVFCNVRRFRSILKIEKTLLKARHLGSIIFHFSLLLIMAGVILNYLYKFEGIYGLTEGQTANDVFEDYHRQFNGPLYAEQSGRFSITLDRVYTDYIVDQKETKAIEVTLHSPDGTQSAGARSAGAGSTEVIYLNRPYQYDDLEFHLGFTHGFSPELVLEDSSGSILFQSFVRLATRKVEGEEKYLDFIMVPSTDTKISIEAFPSDSSLDLTQFEITLEEGGEVVYNGFQTLGETIRIDSHSLRISRLRRWSYIDVLGSPYLNLVFFGFWSALGGMVIGFVPRLFLTKGNNK